MVFSIEMGMGIVIVMGMVIGIAMEMEKVIGI
jgi:hypothetical protein